LTGITGTASPRREDETRIKRHGWLSVAVSAELSRVGLTTATRNRATIAFKSGENMAHGQRHYSDEQRENAVAAVAANAGNVTRTARELGIPEPTLRGWMRTVTCRAQTKTDLASAIEDIAWRIVEALPRKLAKASFKDATVALAIAVDKARLLREQATSISAKTEATLTDEERWEGLQDLARRIQARREAQRMSNGHVEQHHLLAGPPKGPDADGEGGTDGAALNGEAHNEPENARHDPAADPRQDA
jgi:transposase-like protein